MRLGVKLEGKLAHSQTAVKSDAMLAITLFIYVLIILAFNKARSKYKGGRVGDAINLILVTVALLFVAVGLLGFILVFSWTCWAVLNTMFSLGTFFRKIDISSMRREASSRSLTTLSRVDIQVTLPLDSRYCCLTRIATTGFILRFELTSSQSLNPLFKASLNQ